MMCEFKQSAERVGLKIHLDKTKILSDQSSNRRTEMEINNIEVDVSLRAREQHQTAEIKNRIRAAWASFNRYKRKLTSKSYFLQHRLHLFNVVITPTLSYASGTWTLSRKHEKTIDSTKNASPHRPDEKKVRKENSDQQNEIDGKLKKQSKTDCDQDNDVSFMKDTDEEIDS